MDAHDPHQSFIKTPQQLIVVILLSFLVPIIGIILLVQLVLSRPGADPQALTPEAVAARIQPVGRVEFGAPPAAPGARSGEAIVQATCSACHQAGVANAPKIGDKNAWAPHIKLGLGHLVQSVVKGKGAMPPRAGDPSLTDAEIARAVAHMANQAGANFKAPAAKDKPAAAAAAHQDHGKPAAASKTTADGKGVYDKVCFVCHQQSVAGSPKLGDKAAWAPRIKTGTGTMVQSVIKGKGAMPPKAGNPALSEGEIRAAVEFMVSQSK
ncbi:MAG TPA: c-type cytochrome [Burkholderiales bacterium]|nr:c-type cytochrome [Burkholderiales bacterium]